MDGLNLHSSLLLQINHKKKAKTKRRINDKFDWFEGCNLFNFMLTFKL